MFLVLFEVSSQKLSQIVLLFAKLSCFIILFKLNIEINRFLRLSSFYKHKDVLIGEPCFSSNLLLQYVRIVVRLRVI